MIRRLHRSTLFPYTTLFRSRMAERDPAAVRIDVVHPILKACVLGELQDNARERLVHLDHRDVVPRQPRLRKGRDRKSTRLNSSHTVISYAVFCLKKKTQAKR